MIDYNSRYHNVPFGNQTGLVEKSPIIDNIASTPFFILFLYMMFPLSPPVIAFVSHSNSNLNFILFRSFL